MENRKGFFSGLVEGVAHVNALLKERDDVNLYRQSSDVFKKLQVACLQKGVNRQAIETVKSLNSATTFNEMFECIKGINVDKEPLHIRCFAKTAIFFGSYFVPDANAAYYFFQLKEDIEKFAIAKGHFSSMAERKEAPSVRRTG